MSWFVLSYVIVDSMTVLLVFLLAGALIFHAFRNETFRERLLVFLVPLSLVPWSLRLPRFMDWLLPSFRSPDRLVEAMAEMSQMGKMGEWWLDDYPLVLVVLFGSIGLFVLYRSPTLRAWGRARGDLVVCFSLGLSFGALSVIL